MINLQSKIKSRQKKGNLGLHLQNEGRKAGLKVLNIDAGLTLGAGNVFSFKLFLMENNE